jgi:chaperonin GroES
VVDDIDDEPTEDAPTIRMRPVGERIVVQLKQVDNVSAGGVILPEQAREKPKTGIVISIGRLCPEDIREGQEVMFSKYGGIEVEHEGEEYLVLLPSDILVVFEEGDGVRQL